MGKPTSCFKIITCGSDPKDHEDIDVPENKATGEKRGWSFRKRSARQRVLSNSVIAETLPFEFKDSFETAGLDSQQTANSKFVTDCVNEKPQLSCPEDAKPFEVVVSTHDEDEDDFQMEESIVIVIQTAIRGLLAQIALAKLKSVVKLQAAVRGHVVRRHAVGTLRCIQAIVKMQALVRARSSLRSSGGLNRDKSDRNNEHDLNRFKTRENKEFDKSKVMYVSMEKLLSSRFAQQLLDSSPKTTPINIKCDPLKSDSAWKWLERWTSVSSVDIVEQNKAEMISEKAGDGKERDFVSQLDNGIDEQNKAEMISEKAGDGKERDFVSQLDNGIDSEVCDSDDAIFVEKKSSLPNEGVAELSTLEDESLEAQACEATSSSERETEEMKDKSMEAETGKYSPDQMAQSVVHPQSQCDYNPEKKVAEDEQPIMKGVLAEQPENDCRKSVVGSRKATNPAFIAAQSRFEMLSSTANSGKSTSLSLEENTESREQTVSSPADTAVETKELDSSENFSLPGSRVMLSGGSECGTELSISSTLDSPDRCDSGTFELEHNGNVLAEDIPDSNRCKTADVGEVDVTPAISLSNLSEPILDEQKKSDLVISESIILGDSPDSGTIEVKAAESNILHQPAESNILHQPAEVDSETGNQACRVSPDASPKSHITVPESQGTPSSQLSVKANKNKVDNTGSNSKRKSLSASKKSHNSGSRSSPDHSAKDQKIGKRRNSFGSARPDNVELESSDSTSNNSLPHFMQATESARAKLNPNNSPRSSPDIQDRDIVKKRRSLSGTNGRQGSPRIQRSTSQTQQSAKGNESKWQR